MIRKVLPLLALVLCLCCPVRAAEPTGSISVTAPAGGSVTLYRVGSIAVGGIRPVEDFSLWGDRFDDLQSPELARDLAQFAREHKLLGTTRIIGREGSVTFSDLESGAYLLTQDTAAPGYFPMEPFLVAIPWQIGEEIIYHVNANPKVTEESAPTTGDDSAIPELLLTLCLSITALGYLLCFRKSPQKKRSPLLPHPGKPLERTPGRGH